jgi:pimeloyl-ACP methyl ester carboxylesterase
MRTSVVSRGFNVSYRAEGRGTPLVLLHGWSMWADNWWDGGYADELVGEFRVIAIDFLGHGESDKPHDPDDYRDDLVVSDIVAMLDAEHVERALVSGYSMGAVNAASLAVSEPSRVAALVCGGEAPLPAPEGRREGLLSVAESVRSVEGLEAFIRQVGTPDEMVEEYLAANDAAALSAVMTTDSSDDRPEAADVQAPSLWYQGSEDAPFSQPNLDIAARFGVETHLIPGADRVVAFR